MAYTPHTWTSNELVSASKMNAIEQGIKAVQDEAVQLDQLSSTTLTSTAGTPTNTANRTYPVTQDANGKLAVNVPWVDTNTQTITGVKGDAESSYRTGNVNITPANVGAVSISDVANNLTTTDSGKVLDARQGKVLNDAIDLKLDKANVVNNLTTTAEGYALDARQGKAIKDYIDDLTEKTDDLIDMITTNHFYAGILSASNEIITDESGNEILGEWKLKEV